MTTVGMTKLKIQKETVEVVELFLEIGPKVNRAALTNGLFEREVSVKHTRRRSSSTESLAPLVLGAFCTGS